MFVQNCQLYLLDVGHYGNILGHRGLANTIAVVGMYEHGLARSHRHNRLLWTSDASSKMVEMIWPKAGRH